MNLLIENYFDWVEICLIESSIVNSYTLIRREISLVDGKLRIKSLLDDNSLLELFLYFKEINKQIEQSKYSFHWQNAQGNLIRRWDNAPHHLHLENAPHHVHYANEMVQASHTIPDIIFVIAYIEQSK